MQLGGAVGEVRDDDADPEHDQEQGREEDE
jgi:hypothetical protein